MNTSAAIRSKLVRAIKRTASATPLSRFYAPRYTCMFNPAELAFLCRCVQETSPLRGPMGEIGCFRGDTTIFLRKFANNIGHPGTYFAFDTFEGFTAEDIEFETTVRGRKSDKPRLTRGFSTNKQAWFDAAIRNNGLSRVESVRADASTYTFPELDGCSFCLIDVDLYRPVRAALDHVFQRCAPGAIIVIDDCRDNQAHIYDGAFHAYADFLKAMGLPKRIVAGKLGVVQKPLG